MKTTVYAQRTQNDNRAGVGKPRAASGPRRAASRTTGRRTGGQGRTPHGGTRRPGQKRMEGQRVGQEGRDPLLPDPAHAQDGGRRTGVVRQDGAQARLRGAGRAGRAPGRGSLRRLHRPRSHSDAFVREHRRLRRHRHDGRHVGHGGLLRPDRQTRPPLGRRGHRRRARTRAGRARDHRGQLLHRLALHSGRGCARLPRSGARLEHRDHRLDAHHRRHGA